MEKQELICICCPLGCPLQVTLDGKTVLSVTGNTCRRGEEYAKKEVVSPTRVVTSTVPVEGGTAARVSVKTKEDIPKGEIFPCIRALKQVKAAAPVHIGDVVLANVAGTGVDVVATREVERKVPGA